MLRFDEGILKRSAFLTKIDVFINAVAEASELSKKDAGKAVDKIQLIGFGNFEVQERAARTGRNLQTGEEIEIAASKVPAFSAGKVLKDAVKNYLKKLLNLHIK